MNLNPEHAQENTSLIRIENVSAILERKGSAVWCISPSATVYQAIVMMDERRVGALVVAEEGLLKGILSERDYARKVILKGRSSKETTVEEIMSSPVITVTPLHSVDEALRIVTANRIRHLPVLEGDRLVGLVSIGDLVNSLLSLQAETVRHLSNYILASYPA